MTDGNVRILRTDDTPVRTQDSVPSGHGITGNVQRVGLPLSCVPRTQTLQLATNAVLPALLPASQETYRFPLTSNVQQTGSSGEKIQGRRAGTAGSPYASTVRGAIMMPFVAARPGLKARVARRSNG
ncbi:hypothetical protein VTN00DRAFT_9930 [Thermoascus crustaceus]|uniref:uncharacterized protein n=1 Tax=Thermoascus crustaceus TaxID=5088 RepID=UPI003744A540